MEIIGILNVTPDSFSDGGKHLKNPIKDALKMIKDGATIIDIGGQTTKPGAEIITTNTELSRVIPVLRKLKEVIGSKKMDVKISIDTMNSTVALESIKLGVDFINDVSMGKYDKNMLGVVSQNNVKYIISHSINPMDHLHDVINKNTILNNVVSELNERVEQLIKNKICKNKIIIDPGIGFSKPTWDLNWPLLVNLNEFKKIGCPILIGASRKRFLSSMCGEDNINWRKKDKATAIISLLSFLQNAWGVRVHDVKTTVSLLKKFNEN